MGLAFNGEMNLILATIDQSRTIINIGETTYTANGDHTMTYTHQT
jgi:hypothetical protein